KAKKDASGQAEGWNEAQARETLKRHLDGRQEEINTEFERLYKRYRSPLHEQEAHYLTDAVDRAIVRDVIQASNFDEQQERAERSRQWRDVPKQQADKIRQKATDSKVVLTSDKSAKAFVDKTTAEIVKWRDNLTTDWEAGAQQRARIAESYDRAFELSKRHAAKNVKQGESVDALARQYMDNPPEALVSDRAFETARNEYLTRSDSYYRQFGGVHDVITQRQKQLEDAVKRFARENGLPELKIEFREFLDSASAGYDRGSGVIRISHADLLTRADAYTLVANLSKQLIHAQQDAQIIRSIIDGKDNAPEPGKRPTADQIERIKQQYKEQTGSELDGRMLDEVLAIRRLDKDRPYSDAEMTRAKELAASFKASREAAIKFERLGKNLRAVDGELEVLRSTTEGAATDLVRRLVEPGNEALMEQLFGVRKITDLPPDHPVRKAVEELTGKYEKASVGGLRPGLEVDGKWSEKAAREILAKILDGRATELAKNRADTYLDYMRASHAQEASVVGDDMHHRTTERSTELEAPREGDGTRKEVKEAEARLEQARYERLFMEEVRKNFYRDRAMPTGKFDRGLQAAMEATLGKLNFGGDRDDIPKEEVIKHGKKLLEQYSGEGEPAKQAVDRVGELMADAKPASGRPNRTLDLPYDPFPSKAELRRIGEGSQVTETTETGIKIRRRGVVREWSTDKPPSREEVLEVLQERIEELKKRHEEMKKRGTEIPKEELKLVEYLEKAKTDLTPGKFAKAKGYLESGFRGGRAVAGTAIGAAIIVSAVLSWYIAANEGGRVPPEFSSLSLPSV
ncbi:MAG: hypothetical protein K2Z81_15130, partial [Cyanobacteria bacterium]|nr:hypothetical protein [Cyanobacteriota bacterium]